MRCIKNRHIRGDKTWQVFQSPFSKRFLEFRDVDRAWKWFFQFWLVTCEEVVNGEKFLIYTKRIGWHFSRKLHYRTIKCTLKMSTGTYFLSKLYSQIKLELCNAPSGFASLFALSRLKVSIIIERVDACSWFQSYVLYSSFPCCHVILVVVTFFK